jgi:alkaline phosphatase D
MDYIDDLAILSEELISLELEITTVDAGDAGSGDSLFVNVVFADGTRLYEPMNRPIGSLPGRGESEKFVLLVAPGLGRTLGDIAEVFLSLFSRV